MKKKEAWYEHEIASICFRSFRFVMLKSSNCQVKPFCIPFVWSEFYSVGRRKMIIDIHFLYAISKIKRGKMDLPLNECRKVKLSIKWLFSRGKRKIEPERAQQYWKLPFCMVIIVSSGKARCSLNTKWKEIRKINTTLK